MSQVKPSEKVSPKIFSSVLSEARDWRKALGEVTSKIAGEMGTTRCDLAVCFLSEGFSDLDPALFLKKLARDIFCNVIIGCNASGVIGGASEIEMEPAMSVLAMRLPGASIRPFTFTQAETNDLSSGAELIGLLDVYPTDRPKFLFFADPMSCDISRVLKAFNEGYPGCPVIGGLASGQVTGAPNWLALNGEVLTGGAVGVALTGEIGLETLVAQGCRPVGKPYIMTQTHHNVLQQLAGRPAFEVLKEVFQSLSSADQILARHSLFVGLAMTEKKTRFDRGDFLVRNIMGYDAPSGALVVGAELRPGQTVQFQLRDSGTSAEDLRMLLKAMNGRNLPEAKGALLISCCGRGRGLYGVRNHDIDLIQSLAGPLPVTGFFANGEIGPVGRENFVHGYTSSLAIFH